MQKNMRWMLAGCLCLGLAGLVTSCEKGPAQKVGESIDKGVQNTKDALHDAKEDVTRDR